MVINKKSQVRTTGLIMLLFLIILTVIAVEYEQEETLNDTYTTNTNTLSIPLPKNLENYKGYSLNVIGKGDGNLKDNVIYFNNVQENLGITLTLFYKNENVTREFEI